MTSLPRIGASACLLGEEVRFDGGHKQNHFTKSLSRFFQLIPVCPEMSIGLGVPRDTLRLVGSPEAPRLIEKKSGRDLTQDMIEWSSRFVESAQAQGLAGFVLKKDSPSCGLQRVRVYHENGIPSKNGSGIFAKILEAHFPTLPIEEGGRLQDPHLRTRFLIRVFGNQRLDELFSKTWNLQQLIDFHSREKCLLLAHNPKRAKQLGRLVAQARHIPRSIIEEQYRSLFAITLQSPLSKNRHLDILQKMLRTLKKQVSASAKQHLYKTLEDYRDGFLPLEVPLALLKHHAISLGHKYLQNQSYFQPYDKVLYKTDSVMRV